MFLCPLTSTKLKPALVRGSNIWYSKESEGRLINLSVAKKILGQDISTELWVRSGLPNAITSWKKCPSCSRPMKIVIAPQWAKGFEVDVCRNCHLLWLDKMDFPEVPVPNDMISEHGDASRVLAVAHESMETSLRQERKENPSLVGDGPDSLWKAVPAFLGLPVEMEDDRQEGLGWLTWILALAMLLIHLYLTSKDPEFIQKWSFIPSEGFRHSGLTLLTSGFIHADWLHLVSNLYFFGVFSDDLEIYYGRFKFLLLIFGQLIFSALVTSLTDGTSQIHHLGISGVISAVMVNYGLIYRKSRIAFLLPYMHTFTNGSFTRVFGWIRLSSLWVIMGFVVKDLLLFSVFELNEVYTISYSGHLIGAIFGFLFWFLNGRPSWYTTK